MCSTFECNGCLLWQEKNKRSFIFLCFKLGPISVINKVIMTFKVGQRQMNTRIRHLMVRLWRQEANTMRCSVIGIVLVKDCEEQKSTFSLSENLESWHGASPCQTELVEINIIVVLYVAIYRFCILLLRFTLFCSFPARRNESKEFWKISHRKWQRKKVLFTQTFMFILKRVLSGRVHIIFWEDDKSTTVWEDDKLSESGKLNVKSSKQRLED